MKRVITGLALGFSVVLLVLYAPVFWFFIIVVLITSFALFEYYTMTTSQDKGMLIIGTLLGAIVAAHPAAIFFFGFKNSGYLPFAIFIIFCYCLFTYNPLAPDRNNQRQLSAVSRAGIGILGIIYIALPLSHLFFIRNFEQGRFWILFLLSIVFANDTFAYFVGKGVGRRKLAPLVSPGKTVEGAIGGLIGGVIAAAIFQFFFKQLAFAETAMLAIVIGIVGQLGDLFESMIKRSAGVKDSGNIIPGHGGALDRIDSLIFAVPFLYYYLVWRF